MVISVLTALACSAETAEDEVVPEADEQVDPVAVMTNMQYFLYKTGLSLRADNQELADFYMHEIEEMIEELKQIEDFEGHNIAELVEIMLEPHVVAMAETIDTGDSQAALGAMDTVINGCNACHTTTDHDFINIVDNSEQNVFMQSFAK